MSLPKHVSALVLESKRCRYTRLKALTATASGLMTPDNVNREAGDLLAAIWKTHPDKPLLVNCSGIAALSNYALHGLIEAANETDNALIFFNAIPNVASDIGQELPTSGTHARFSKELKPQSDSTETVTYLPALFRHNSVPGLIKEGEKVDAEHMQNIIRDTFHRHDSGKLEPLHSTPILASGIYNARHIICEADQFNWTVLHLEEELDALVPDWDLTRHCLLSGSLRACPFAAALAFMKTPPRAVEIFDHFGPHPVLLEEHDLGPARRGIEYIYIGDFMIGGTEIKIAANWAAHRNCRISKALVLGTLWKEDRYKMGEITIKRLASLDRLHPLAKYALETP